jgi:hypothetical protein
MSMFIMCENSLKESSSHEVGKEQKQLSLECFSKITKDVGRRHCFKKILQQKLAKKERGICFRNVFIKRMKGGRGS